MNNLDMKQGVDLCTQQKFHEPLVGDEIRLLILEPGPSSDPIKCRLDIVSFRTGPSYDALSYVWGDASDTSPIVLNGNSYRVRKNLELGLRHLRSENFSRALWVDALCINQKNNSEKMHQVNMMGNIYRQCNECLIWLGEIPGASENITIGDAQAALEFIEFCTGLPDFAGRGGAVPLTLSTRPRIEKARTAFISLTSNAWWFRIWTVQEAVFPSRALVCWGPLSLSWSILTKAVDNLCMNFVHPARLRVEHGPQFEDIFSVFDDVIDELTQPVRGLDLAKVGEDSVHIFQRWRYRKATNPKDKVYALMGLKHTLSLPNVQSCDYSIDTNLLFTRLTFDLITPETGLKALIGLRSKSNTDLPSWTIDLHRLPPIHHDYAWWDHCHRYEWFDASKNKSLELRKSEDVTILSLNGSFLDSIKYIGGPVMHYDVTLVSDMDLIRTIASWKMVMARFLGDNMATHHMYTPTISYEEAFLTTMIGGLICRVIPERRADRTDSYAVSEFFETGVSNETLSSLRCMVLNQAFFITKLGFMGIGPPDLALGDDVFILYGGRVPFVLRRIDSTGNVDSKPHWKNDYILVGSAYVYAIMDGEAIENSLGLPQDIRLH